MVMVMVIIIAYSGDSWSVKNATLLPTNSEFRLSVITPLPSKPIPKGYLEWRFLPYTLCMNPRSEGLIGE